MFANLPERSMLTVRGLLLGGWLVLIGSLLWDPYSAALTDPATGQGPFTIRDGSVPVQDEFVTSQPYPMGARLFWTMIVPILPLFLMVFGHEAWRRICPLSFASQIPGYLGLTRGRTRLDRRTGKLDRVTALIDRDSWLARNAWYVQFGFLFVGISARLLLINSDRHALAAALCFVIAAAVLTGVLWGGKTWCNYFCPANVVQKIYTEPRGLLESAPHLSRPALPQSMCRKPTRQGDRSSCVGCTVNCGDIDLERSYWQGIENPRRRNTYYMFVGLIIGFYGYYYLYSGNWDYYFSGVWTHEADLRGRIMQPGLYLLGQSVALPRLFAAPMVLALACATTLILGRLLEAGYRRFRRGQRGYSEAMILNHCLSVTAWISINAFYLFGGRPNLALLPTAGVRMVDLLIIALTTLWLRHVIMRTPERYERESMSSRLLDQLRKLRIDIGRVLGGRSLEDLKPDEVFVLSRVLPVVSHDERIAAYRNVLGQAVGEGATASVGTLKLLDELRAQLDLTEEEHATIVDELGVSEALKATDDTVSEEERQQALETYSEMLGNLVASRVAAGRSMDENLADPEFQAMTGIVRQSLQIDERAHLTALARLAQPDGALGRLMHDALDRLIAERRHQFALATLDLRDPLGASLAELLGERLSLREAALCESAIRLLPIFGGGAVAQDYAQALRAAAGATLRQRLAEANGDGVSWQGRLEPEIVDTLLGRSSAGAGAKAPASRQFLLAGMDAAESLERLSRDDDPHVAALALTLLGIENPQAAEHLALALLARMDGSALPLLQGVTRRLAGSAPVPPESQDMKLRVSIEGRTRELHLAGRGQLTIGSGFGNDILVQGPQVDAYHAVLRIEDGIVRLRRLTRALLRVNGELVGEETGGLDSGARIALGEKEDGATEAVLQLEWDAVAVTGERIEIESVMRLAMMARNPGLRRLTLARLFDLAEAASVRRYREGDLIVAPRAVPSSFLVYSGTVMRPSGTDRPAEPWTFGPGDLIASAVTAPDAVPLPRTSVGFAILLQLPGLSGDESELAPLSAYLDAAERDEGRLPVTADTF